MSSLHPKTWIEVSVSALRYNLHQAQEWAGQSRVIPVVKANAYGHGLALVVEALKGERVPFFAVDSIEEAREIASLDVSLPVLLLGYVQQAEVGEVVERGWSFVCSKQETLEAALYAATRERPAKLHIEVETGLHRLGADERELDLMLNIVRTHHERLRVEGVCSHFASAEQIPESPGVAEQMHVFQKRLAKIFGVGCDPVWTHIACSAALWLWSTTCLQAIRLGISLYGIWSSAEVGRELQDRLVLRPAITWKTLVAEIKALQPGDAIGYGATERAERHMTIAVLPVGYADGFDRRLSSCGEVLIRGARCRVIGRVCMNMCMVDVSLVSNVALEDEVVIWGKQGDESLTPMDWEARVPSLIAYEALARVRATIARRLVA